MRLATKKWGRALALAMPAAGLAALLYAFEPGSDLHFLACPTFTLTGLYCPGCGSTRAVHHLLHGRWGQAFSANALLLVGVPAIALLAAVGRHVQDRARAVLFYGSIAACLCGATFFTIARNAGGAWGAWGAWLAP